MNTHRILVVAGGLAGAAGVALSAAASHIGGGNTGIAASFLLMHAPLFVAVGMVKGNGLLRAGSLVVLAGLLLFSGDLLLRSFAATRIFPMAAPTGGTTMILGWLIVTASAFHSTGASGGTTTDPSS